MSACPYSVAPAATESGPAPLIGPVLRVLFRDPTEIIPLLGKLTQGSDRTKISLGAGPAFHVLTHPDDADAVLREKAGACPMTSTRMKTAAYRPGEKLGSLEGGSTAWKIHRKAIGSAVPPGGLGATYANAVNAVLPIIEGWSQKGPVSAERQAALLTVRFAWSALFTEQLDDTDAEEIADIGADRIQKYFLWTMATMGKLPPALFRAASGMRKFTDLIGSKLEPLIERRLATPRGQWPADYLTQALEMTGLAQDPQNAPLRAKAVCNLEEMLLASYLNTKGAVYWGLQLLAENPDMQDRVASGEDPQAALKIALETLRLYPPVYLLPRQAGEDLALSGNYNIKAGSQLLIPSWHIHRDPRWYAAPDRFDPDMNFSESAVRERPKGAFLPFGGGQRKCPGYGMALQEMTALFSIICGAHKIERDPASPAPYVRAATLLNPEKNSRLRIVPRPSASAAQIAESLKLVPAAA